MVAIANVSRRGALSLAAGAGLSVLAKPVLAGTPEIEILAEGLAFPEGPVVMPDGSVIVVELLGGTIKRVWNGKAEVVSEIGGGPNGAQLGPDGALYVCNNGGAQAERPWLADPAKPGRIERLDLSTGKVERIYEKVGDRALSAPNDLVFDKQGGMWITDFGKVLDDCWQRGGIYYARPDGSEIREIAYDGFGYNGIGLTADEKTLYVADNHAGRLYRMALGEPGELAAESKGHKVEKDYIGSAPGEGEFDGLALTASGAVCVGTNVNGGLTTFSPAGEVTFLPLPDRMVTNIAFGGKDMRDAYVTFTTTGRLARIRWPEPGLKLNFG